MFDSAPRLSHGAVTVRGIKLRDARTLETELQVNRPWLERWEATLPGTRPSGRFDTRSSIRSLLDADRDGSGLALVIEVDGEFAGQLNVANISGGALASSTLGYWIARRFAGRGATTTAVALVTDHLMLGMGLHRDGARVGLELHLLGRLGRLGHDAQRLLQPDGVALGRQVLALPGPHRHEVGDPEHDGDDEDEGRPETCELWHALHGSGDRAPITGGRAAVRSPSG